MMRALQRSFRIFYSTFPYQVAPIRSYSNIKGNNTIIRVKINKEMKEIYEFFRHPDLHFGEIKLTKDEHSGIAYITLNYPHKRNAISGTLMC